jgi:hypothetical protein
VQRVQDRTACVFVSFNFFNFIEIVTAFK